MRRFRPPGRSASHEEPPLRLLSREADGSFAARQENVDRGETGRGVAAGTALCGVDVLLKWVL